MPFLIRTIQAMLALPHFLLRLLVRSLVRFLMRVLLVFARLLLESAVCLLIGLGLVVIGHVRVVGDIGHWRRRLAQTFRAVS